MFTSSFYFYYYFKLLGIEVETATAVYNYTIVEPLVLTASCILIC